MNKANKEMRARTSVDLLNACILFIKLEVNRYYKMKKEVWGGSSILTPRGIEEYEATFTHLHPRHFSFCLKDYDDKMEVRVKRINDTPEGTREWIAFWNVHLRSCTDRCGAV